jgi:hypothetical protein
MEVVTRRKIKMMRMGTGIGMRMGTEIGTKMLQRIEMIMRKIKMMRMGTEIGMRMGTEIGTKMLQRIEMKMLKIGKERRTTLKSTSQFATSRSHPMQHVLAWLYRLTSRPWPHPLPHHFPFFWPLSTAPGASDVLLRVSFGGLGCMGAGRTMWGEDRVRGGGGGCCWVG